MLCRSQADAKRKSIIYFIKTQPKSNARRIDATNPSSSRKVRWWKQMKKFDEKEVGNEEENYQDTVTDKSDQEVVEEDDDDSNYEPTKW